MDKTKKIELTIAAIVAVAAIIALIPAFGQWLSPRTPASNSAATSLPTQVTFVTPTQVAIVSATVRPTMTPTLPTTKTAPPIFTPIPSPTGRIAFCSGPDYGLYVMNADGTNPQKLTNHACCPTWSPDGRSIAFSSNGLYIMNDDGTNPRRLTDEGLHPTWSPDGGFIAFTSSRDGNGEIYVMNADGTNPRRLTNNPADDWDPAWSPNGRFIAFVSNRDEPDLGNCGVSCNEEIYVMDVDGTNQRRLTNNKWVERLPAWSPDGRYIAFYSRGNDNVHLGIYIMYPDGTSQHMVTEGDARESIAWSPDGKIIAFESLISGGWGIHIVTTDGTNLRAINTGDAWGPAWTAK